MSYTPVFQYSAFPDSLKLDVSYRRNYCENISGMERLEDLRSDLLIPTAVRMVAVFPTGSLFVFPVIIIDISLNFMLEKMRSISFMSNLIPVNLKTHSQQV